MAYLVCPVPDHSGLDTEVIPSDDHPARRSEASLIGFLLPLAVLLPAALIMAITWLREKEHHQRSGRIPYRVFMFSQYIANLGMCVLALVRDTGNTGLFS